MKLRQELYIAAYNANPLTRGEIKEKGIRYIWTDGSNEAYNSHQVERLGLPDKVSDILDEVNDSDDSLATMSDFHLENRYTASD